MNSIRNFILLSLVALALCAAPLPAGAQEGGVRGGLNDLKTKAGDALPSEIVADDDTAVDLFAKIVDIAVGIGFAIAVIFFIYGGYMYITSAGNSEAATKAKNTLFYAIIGMVVILLSYVVIKLVVRAVTDPENTFRGSNRSAQTNISRTVS